MFERLRGRCACYAAGMKLRVLAEGLALALALAGCFAGQHNATGAAGTQLDSPAQGSSRYAGPGAVFDYYLLNLSWSPEFCYAHPSAAECAAHAAFVLHGMWPQNNDGTYPENCSEAAGPANPAQYSDIYADQGLLAHEWRAHGSCSGLNADDFFSAARTAYRSVKIPPALSGLTSQTSMPPDQILDMFAASNPGIPRASLALSCGNNYLTSVEVCLDKGLHPTACGAIRTCRARMVRVPAPGL